jgi:Spy/CpxP family protein refolding chaperone
MHKFMLPYVLSGIFLAAPMAFANNGGNFSGGEDTGRAGMHHQWNHGSSDPLLAQVLNLNDDQKKQLDGLKTKQKEDKKALLEQIKANREALMNEIVKAAPDMNKVNDLQTQLKNIQAQKADAQLNSLLEIKKLMTPEQFAGFLALEKEHHLRNHHHFHKHTEMKMCPMPEKNK